MQPTQLKNNLLKENIDFQPNHFPNHCVKCTCTITPAVVVVQGEEGAGMETSSWKQEEGWRSHHQNKCINANAVLGLWEDTNPLS